MCFLALPSIHPSTCIENVFSTCLCTFLLYYSTIKENVVLVNVFQTLENKSVNTTVFCYMSGARARSLQKVLANTWLTSSLHVCQHLTHRGIINCFAICCHPSIAWILPQVHLVSLLFGSAISTSLLILLRSYLHLFHFHICTYCTEEYATALQMYGGHAQDLGKVLET